MGRAKINVVKLVPKPRLPKHSAIKPLLQLDGPATRLTFG